MFMVFQKKIKKLITEPDFFLLTKEAKTFFGTKQLNLRTKTFKIFETVVKV